MFRKKNLKMYLTLLMFSLFQNASAKNFDAYDPVENLSKKEINIKNILKKDSKVLLENLNNITENEVLEIEDGEYSDLGIINILKDGITIRARNPGKVIFSGIIQLNFLGNNNTFEGVIFTNGGPAQNEGAIVLKGNNNVVKNNTFYKFNKHKYEANEKGEFNSTRWMTVGGKNNIVSDNRFEGKYKRGTLLVVNNSPEYDNHILVRNIFKDHTPNLEGEFKDEKMIRINSNGWEALRIGDSKTSLLPSGTALIYNIFDNMDGETELVSVKACDTTLFGNTVIESASMISLRHGNNSVIENNVILGNGKNMTGGIRFYGEDHIIRNNYIENVTGVGNTRAGIAFNTGVNNVAENEKLDNKIKGKELNKQWTPKNILLENNTVINSNQNIMYSDKVHKVSLFDDSKVEVIYPALNMTLKNNLSYANKDGKKALVGAGEERNPINTKYINNIFYGPIEKVNNAPELLTEVEVSLENKNGILEFSKENIGAKNLKVLKESIIGPSYIINF
ncbi:polysaccharide lyase 6 family protein [Cetobacterium sp.]|uniref:polysaccharide lyase 6 family protein n=1 Tax=Cetobacterium sp. TaxID=2071632 RepID=UPI003EE78E74